MTYNRLPLLPTIAVISVLTQIAVIPIKNYCERKAYEEARIYAVQRFGDKQEPLIVSEQASWYKFMRVEEGKKPNIKQLREYNNFEKSASKLENLK